MSVVGSNSVQVKDNKAGTLDEHAGWYNFRLTKFHNVPHSKIRHSAKEYVRGEVHEHGRELILTAQAGCRPGMLRKV